MAGAGIYDRGIIRVDGERQDWAGGVRPIGGPLVEAGISQGPPGAAPSASQAHKNGRASEPCAKAEANERCGERDATKQGVIRFVMLVLLAAGASAGDGETSIATISVQLAHSGDR